jgi:hypothetical protein
MVTRRSLLAVAGTGGLVLASGCLDLARGDKAEYRASPAAVDSATVEDEQFEDMGSEELKIERDVDPPVADKRTVTVYNWLAKYGKEFDFSQLDAEAVQEQVEEASGDSELLANQSIELATLEANGISEELLLQKGLDREDLEDGSVDIATLQENGIDLETLKDNGIDLDALNSSTGGESVGSGEAIAPSTDRKGVLFGVLSTPQAEVLGRNLNPVSDLEHKELLEKFGDRLGDQQIDEITLLEESTATVLGESVPLSIFKTTTQVEEMEIELHIYVFTKNHEGDILVGAGIHPKFMDAEDSIRTMMQNVQHPVAESESSDSESSDS